MSTTITATFENCTIKKDPTHFIEVYGNDNITKQSYEPLEIEILPVALESTSEVGARTIALFKIYTL